MTFLNRVRTTVGKYGMLPAKGRIIAAVSGGPDSMAMLEALLEILGDRAIAAAGAPEDRLVVAHLHHGIRGGAADVDAEFVRQYAEARAIRFVLGWEDVPARAEKERRSLEEAARLARLEFLTRTAGEERAGAVALAHTADDQAETVLLRLLRGSGISGLSGMRPVRELSPGVRLIRPLIEIERSEVERFLAERGVPYRTDETNRDVRFPRNRIRHRVMPLLREIQPRASAVLARAARLLSEAADFLDEAASGALSELGAPRRGEPFEIAVSRFEQIAPALKGPVLRKAFRLVSGLVMSSGHVGAALRLVTSFASARVEGNRLDLPGGWRMRRSGGRVVFEPPGDVPENGDTKKIYSCPREWSVGLPVPGEVVLPDGRALSAEVVEKPARAAFPSGSTVWLDYDAAGSPRELEVRSRRPGDRFRPLGSPGMRTIKRFLVDEKVPRELRHSVPLVTAGGEILWLAPYRIADRFRVTDGTGRVLVLRLRGGEGG